MSRLSRYSKDELFCLSGTVTARDWLDSLSWHRRGKSRASTPCEGWKPRNFQWRSLLQKLMVRSGLSATTRVVNVGVEFPISCYLFFCFFVFFFSFSFLFFLASRRRRSTKRRCAIKCHKMKCPTMKGNDGGGVRRKRTSREWTAEPIAMSHR